MHDCHRHVPAGRQGRDRHRRLERARRRVRAGARRGRRRRRARRPPGGPAQGHRRARARRRPACARASPPTSPTPQSAPTWSRWRWRSSAGSTCSSTTPASAPPCPPPGRRPSSSAQVIDVNLNGCYWMAQACGRVMQPGSSIINITSVLGLTTAGLPQAAYAASKAGLIGMTRDLAQQWTGRKGIRVNAIAPGFFASEMTDQYPPGYLESQEPADPGRPQGRPRRARRHRGLPRLRRGRLRHRPDAAGRRRHDDHLTPHPVPIRPADTQSSPRIHLPDGRTSPSAPSLSSFTDERTCSAAQDTSHTWRWAPSRASLS